MDINNLLSSENIGRILEGTFVTFKIALISLLISFVLGIIVGEIVTSKNKVIKAIWFLYLESMRIIPILVWLFIGYFGISTWFNLHLESFTVAVIVFSMWGVAEMGELVRGGITSIPSHQLESGKALGLSKWDIYRYILIPQSLKRVIPGAINLGSRMIKTTSLVVLIGVVEVVKVGQQIIERGVLYEPKAAFVVYGLIFIIYFLLCYPLSVFSRVLEKRLTY